MRKYIKINSLTWWSAVVPLLAGLFIAFEPVHGWSDLATAVKNASGMSAPVLINIGLAGIGLRGAIK